MQAKYKHWDESEMVVDVEKFWLEMNDYGFHLATKQFNIHLDTGEPYLYGRNNTWLMLMYAEEERCRLKLQYSWVPTEVWQEANKITGRLLKV